MKNNYKDWSTDDLRKEAEIICAEIYKRERKEDSKKQKNRNINGITPKDIVVEIWTTDGDDLYYSFYILYEGKRYDIYYDGIADYDNRSKENNWGYHSWWPINPDEENDEYATNGAFLFIPDGFSEAMENAYNFNGTIKQAIKKLKSCGITNVNENIIQH